ncbi:MAG TPA: hypothetical protein VM013_05850 [Dehalococcoidia bacterium]|nr:hypothetical protein [Dehalococcoidia bacterium]
MGHSISPKLLLPFLAGVVLIACNSERHDPDGAQTPAAIDVTPTPTPVAVPAAFQPLYDELQTRLEAAHTEFAARPGPGESPSLVLELLAANGNRGEELLRPDTLDTTRLFLDRFKELGAAGVAVQIVYPLLEKDYPRSDEYLAFYRAVAGEVRKRGLTLIIATGAPFSGTEFSTLRVDYSGKTPEGYLQERLDQASVVAHELRPDYLCLSEEQSTERMLTGLDITTDDYFDFLSSAPAAIEPPSGVKLGAGSGSWERPDLIQRLTQETSLDFVDIHIYPLSSGFTDYLQVTADWASAAGAAGKEVIVGEAWLYKASEKELQSGIGFQELVGRDVYSFWQPLDVLFMQTAAELGRATGVRYLSFFWSRYLFGYVDYDDLPPGTTGQALQQAANLASWTAFVRGELSAAGTEFKRLASPSSEGG